MKTIRIGIEELDRGIGGGIPHPSLIIIEGEHGSGKTVLSQYMIKAFLDNGLRVLSITSEATVKEYLSMMDSLGLKATDSFLSNRLLITPLYVEGGRWSGRLSSLFLMVTGNFLELKKDKYDLTVIDSLSVLTVNVEEHDLLTFITRLKNIVSYGKTVLLTFHPDFLPRGSMTRLRAASDVYFVTRNARFLGMPVKVLETVKLWGSKGERRGTLYFEVDPQMGLRVLPLGAVST